MITVITWDAGFRESFHTADCFNIQTLPRSEYEFIWVEYFSDIDSRISDKLKRFPNARSLCYGGTAPWHLGRAINSAAKVARGDILVITDGDILVSPDFLNEIRAAHQTSEDTVIYCRRWDEPKPIKPGLNQTFDFEAMKSKFYLANPTNFGGCISLRKHVLNRVGGYEEHELFAEAGAIGKELYIRLKNAGMPIVWHPELRIYHPWHEGSSPSSAEYVEKLALQNSFINASDRMVHKVANSPAAQKIINEICAGSSKKMVRTSPAEKWRYRMRSLLRRIQ